MKRNPEERHRRLRQLFEEFNSLAISIMRDCDVRADNQGYCKHPKIHLIQQIVARHYNLPMSVMTSQVRTAEFAGTRYVAMYLVRELTNHSLEQIAGCFAKRDHTTILNGHRAVSDRMQTEKTYENEVNGLMVHARLRLETADLPLFAQSR